MNPSAHAKKCLVFIIENLVGGGAEKVVLTLAQEILRQGHRVHIILLERQLDYEVPDDIEIHFLDCGTVQNKQSVDRAAERLNELLNAIETAENLTIDAVISNMIRSDQIVAQLDHYRTYFCIHNNTSLRELTSKNPLKRYLIKKKLRALYADHRIIAVSQGVGDDMIQNFGVKKENLRIIYNPLDIEEIEAKASEAQEFPFDEFIVHVGSFKRQKRHDRLFAAYLHSGIKIPLVVLGKGSSSRTRHLEQLCKKMGIEKRVYFAGFKKNPYPWIKKAKMLVLSSECEGFALVIAEALICGTPVASVDCPSGPAEILSGDLSGCLSQENAGSLGETMKAVLNNPPRVGPENVRRFAVRNIAGQYLAL